MAKILRFHGESGSKIVLDQNATSGDYIDISEDVQFDISILKSQFQKKINEEAKKIAEDKIKTEKIIAIQNIEKEMNKEITTKQNEITNLKNQINLLNKDIEKDKNNLENKIAVEIVNATKTKDEEIAKLNNQVANLEKMHKLELVNAINKEKLAAKDMCDKLSNSKDQQINQLKGQIEGFQKAKNYNSTKEIGEDLEQYLKTIFDQAQTNGSFENCTFEKINISKEVEGDVKKRKADFLFICYQKIDQTKPKSEWGQIFKVTIEAKNHKIGFDSAEKNEKHYQKLLNDQNNEKSDYALLVTTLEPNETKFDGIFTPQGYKNMYVVRPWNMLSILKMFINLRTQGNQISTLKSMELFENRKKFMDELNDFINDVSYSNDQAQINAIDQVKWIANTIANLKKVGRSWLKWIKHTGTAYKKIYTNKFIKRIEKEKDIESMFEKIKPIVEKQLAEEQSDEEHELIEAAKKMEVKEN